MLSKNTTRARQMPASDAAEASESTTSSALDVPCGVGLSGVERYCALGCRTLDPNVFQYARRLAEATNVVVLEPEVAEAFPNDRAVNNALRRLMRHGKRLSPAGTL